MKQLQVASLKIININKITKAITAQSSGKFDSAFQEQDIQISTNKDEINGIVQNVVKKLHNFEHLKDVIDSCTDKMYIRTYVDCQSVTHPQERDSIFLVLKGQVNTMDEGNAKKVNHQVKRTRMRRAKAEQKEIEMYGGASKTNEEEEKKGF